MAGTRAGRGARHAPLGPRRPLALPQHPRPRAPGAPPARQRVRVAPAAAARDPRRAGVGAAGSATCWRRRGAEGAAPGTAAAAPSASLGHRSGLETRRRLPAPAGCNSYLPAPAWSVGRASGGGRAGAPPPCLPRAGARPARRSRAPAPRPVAVADASRGSRGLSAPGPGRARPGPPGDRPGLAEAGGVFSGWEGASPLSWDPRRAGSLWG